MSQQLPPHMIKLEVGWDRINSGGIKVLEKALNEGLHSVRHAEASASEGNSGSASGAAESKSKSKGKGKGKGGYEEPTKLFKHKDYMEIYSLCYNMCTQRSPYNWSEKLYERHSQTFEEYLLGTVLPAIQAKGNGTQLLEELTRRWDNHTVMNKWMFKFFMCE